MVLCAVSRLSLEVEEVQIQINHLAALTIDIKLLKVDLAVVGVAVSDVCHRYHVVFFAPNCDFAGAAIDILNIELFSEELSAVAKYLHDLFRDHIGLSNKHGVSKKGAI